MKKMLYTILVFCICQSSFSQEKELIFFDSTSTYKKYNIDLNYSLKNFSDEDYIKAYIEENGIQELEGIYECIAHIPLRGKNLKGEYKIAIVSYARVKQGRTNYVAYILETDYKKNYILDADCNKCEYWKKGEVLALFKETELGEFDIHWHHPKSYSGPKGGRAGLEENFGSTNFTQIFWSKRKILSSVNILFTLKAQHIKSFRGRGFPRTEEFKVKEHVAEDFAGVTNFISKYPAVLLNRIWPKSEIDNSIFSNQENDYNKENITIEEAIAQLKELKELLDLGVLTEDEYNKIASKLKRILLEE